MKSDKNETLDIIAILSGHHADLSIWNAAIRDQKNPGVDFIINLAPLFSHAELALMKTVQTHSILTKIINKNTIKDVILSDLTKLFLPIISRVCVYEMQVAAKNKKLLGDNSSNRYQYFIQLLSQKETTLALFNKYPVLKDTIQNAYSQYIKNMIELLLRLNDDYFLICDTFFSGKNDCSLVNLVQSGDRHNNGKCVCILEFESSGNRIKLVYKPRPLAIDQAFQKLIAWLNLKLPEFNLYQQKMIANKNYGWCEFISHLPCQSEQEIELFYQRMGALLALSHLLGSTDIHAENIIANGSHPILIDFECALRPQINDGRVDVIDSRNFVSDTMLLPGRVMSNDDFDGIDLSAIAAKGNQKSLYQKMQWKNPNTDEMCVVRETDQLPTMQNLPFFNDRAINPEDYQSDVMQGFESVYRVLLQNKSQLLASDSILLEFSNATIRIVFRATHIYGKLLFESFHPILLHDSKKYHEHFLWLKSPMPAVEWFNDLIPSELQDLLENNIPYFSIPANGYAVYDSQKKSLPIPIKKSAIERIFDFLNTHFSEEDLKLQKIIIENSFIALRLNQKNKKIPKNKVSQPNVKPYTTEQIKDASLKIAKEALDQLSNYHILQHDQIKWSAVEIVAIDTWTARFTDIDLYNGLTGIGLSFAYGALFFQDKGFEMIARQVLNTILAILSVEREKIKTVGAYSGLGGLLYFLTVFNSLLPDKRIEPELQALLRLATNLIDQDKNLDIISGSAGLILSLLTLRKNRNESILDELILKASKQILSCYPKPDETPSCVTKPISSQPLLGYSHGIAGFVLALTKANQILEKNQISYWIQKALAYERSYFNPEKNNWPDFRNGNNNHSYAWCHGAPGIGLARLYMLDDNVDSTIDNEINLAVQSTIEQSFGTYHNLCHGELGNIEFLLQCCQKKILSDSQFNGLVSRLILNIQVSGINLEVSGTLPLPGLMTGIAGVAYEFMRIANPDKVPSIFYC